MPSIFTLTWYIGAVFYILSNSTTKLRRDTPGLASANTVLSLRDKVNCFCKLLNGCRYTLTHTDTPRTFSQGGQKEPLKELIAGRFPLHGRQESVNE
eukprot:2560446-Pleurochrysis_carterae.AAC.1